MYKEHQYFKDPLSESMLLWRYLDFTKFMYILKRKNLFLPPAAILHKEDSFEGSLPPKDYKLWLKILGTKEKVKSAQDFQRLEFCISCWHFNETESIAMWKLYSQLGNGIAIQTTIPDFKRSFDQVLYDVFIGEVRYIDYKTESFFDGTDYTVEGSMGLAPFIHKRSIYRYEHEYRAIARDQPGHELFGLGLDVPVNHDLLIKKIIVAPLTPNWIYELVKSEVQKELPNITVEHSIYDEKPLV